MRYIGIKGFGHDANIAVLDEHGELILYFQKERTSRIKHDELIGDINEILIGAGLEEITPDDHFFISQPYYYGVLKTALVYNKKYFKKDFLHPLSDERDRLYQLPHHVSHAVSSWLYRKKNFEDEALYIVFDGIGEKTDLSYGFYSIGTISKKGIIEIENNLLDANKYCPINRLEPLPVPGTHRTYTAGKIMGMAGYYHDVEIKNYEEINLSQLQKEYMSFDKRLIRYISHKIGVKVDGIGEKLMKEYASVYKSYINDLKELVGTYLDKYPHKNIVVGGGCFLALELNTYIAERGRNVIFSPAIDDSGLALGSAALGYFLLKGTWPEPLNTPYLQWQPEEDRSGGYIDPKTAAKMLYEGEIIGLITGKGEAGPRALGNRSLLARPSLETMRKVSVDIKGREFYRPVAPIVTDRDFDSLFTGPKGKYMQFRNECTEKAKKLAPGIVHRDGSARAQVLEEKDNPWLYQTLVEFGKLSGVECLINTSLNCGGKPICNTVADAKKEFAGKPVKLVYF